MPTMRITFMIVQVLIFREVRHVPCYDNLLIQFRLNEFYKSIRPVNRANCLKGYFGTNFAFPYWRMCGIVGYIGKRDALPLLIESLRRLEYRGYDSAGIAFQNGSGIEIYKTKGKIKDLQQILPFPLPDARIGLGHTRWATHGPPSSRKGLFAISGHRDCVTIRLKQIFQLLGLCRAIFNYKYTYYFICFLHSLLPLYFFHSQHSSLLYQSYQGKAHYHRTLATSGTICGVLG